MLLLSSAHANLPAFSRSKFVVGFRLASPLRPQVFKYCRYSSVGGPCFISFVLLSILQLRASYSRLVGPPALASGSLNNGQYEMGTVDALESDEAFEKRVKSEIQAIMSPTKEEESASLETDYNIWALLKDFLKLDRVIPILIWCSYGWSCLNLVSPLVCCSKVAFKLPCSLFCFLCDSYRKQNLIGHYVLASVQLHICLHSM